MKVLITGGFGYLGGRFAQFLASQGKHEIILGSRWHSKAPPWLPHGRVARTRWTSSASLEGICVGVDAIVHMAGMNAQDCVADPVKALEFNGVATARLLRSAVKQRVRRFIYISTAHVYGSPLTRIITEDSCPASIHPYAVSHRVGEDVVRDAHMKGEIEGIAIRLSNSYGAPSHKDANCWMLVVNDLCRQAVATRRMVLQSSGLQRRDFIALTDACRAIKHLLELPKDLLKNGLFNVGGRWAPTVLEMTQFVADRIHVATGQKPEIVRKVDQNLENHEIFDYRVTKLLDTGFVLNPFDNVGQEIDGLIRFCRGHMAKNS